MTPCRTYLFAFLLIGALWYAYDTGLDQIPTPSSSDFAIYRLAAVRIVHGQSPFAEPGYIYPPLLAFLLMPLAAIDYLPARWVWFLVSHACLAGAAWLIWRKLGRGLTAACVVTLVWAGGRAAGESVALGQIAPELTLLLAIAYCSSPAARAGAAIGASTALKLIPGVMLFPLLLARVWKPIAAGVLTALLLIAGPWLFVAASLNGPALPRSGFAAGSAAVLNWSMPAIALRIADPHPAHGRAPRSWTEGFVLERIHPSPAQQAIGLGTAAAVFGAGLAAFLAATRSRLRCDQLPLAMAAMVTLILLACPVAWGHYQTLQYPGMALLMGRFASGRRWVRFGAAATAAAFLYPIPVEVLRVLYHHHEQWPESGFTMYLWTSTAALAGAVLYSMILAELRPITVPNESETRVGNSRSTA